MIKGWDEGIAGMKVGGERLLIVPPSLAYGNAKTDGIPANSTLRFGEPIDCYLCALSTANCVAPEVKLVDMK